MILIDNYIDFLVKNKINTSQFLLLYLIKQKRKDLLNKYREAFPNSDGTLIPRLEIKDLVDKGFIIQDKKTITLSDTFIDIFVTPEVAVDEIYDIYPSFITNDNHVKIPLNTMHREIFKNIYIPKIMGNVLEHREVIQDILYAKKHNLIKVGINKFLVSEQWKGFRKLREKDTQTKTTGKAENNFT